MEFIVEYLRKDKNAAYADIRDAAAEQKITIYPIMYGRAQAMLGLVESKPRGQGKAALAKAEKSPAAAAPRATKSASSSFDASSLDGIIAAVRSSEAAKARYRNALEKIQQILGSALG